MANGQRTVKKNLIGQEDILYGEGTVTQERGAGSYPISKVRTIQPVNSTAELAALDTSKFTKARLYTGDGCYIDYIWSGESWEEVKQFNGPVTLIGLIESEHLKLNQIIETVGYHTEGDGGANTYKVVAAGTGVHDGGSYIDCPTAGMQLKGLFLYGITTAQFGVRGIGDESQAFQAALTYMNSARQPLVLNTEVTAGEVISTGYCHLLGPGVFKAKTKVNTMGLRVRNPMTTVTTYSAVATEVYPASTGSTVSKVTVASAAGLQIKDYVFLRDSANTYSENSLTPIAEIAEIIGISGNILYLNCVLRDTMSTGSIYKIPQETCIIDLDIEVADRTNTASCFSILTVEGFVQPQVQTRCQFTNTRAVCPISCYGGTFSVKQQSAVDDSINQDLGYAVACWGACKAISFEIYAIKARHAYTDALWEGSTIEYAGACLDNRVTGVAVSCSSAAWDTHPGSDGVVFYNIEAWSTHQDTDQPDRGQAYAVQLRGTNALVDGLRTNIPSVLAYTVPLQTLTRNSKDIVRNVQHRPKVHANAISLFPSSGSGTVQLKFEHCTIIGGVLGQSGAAYTTEFENCDIDFVNTFVYPTVANYSWIKSRISNPLQVRLEAGVHKFQDFRLEKIGGNLSEGINIRQNAKVHATNVQVWANTVGYSCAFLINATTGVELYYSNISLRIDAGTPAGAVKDLGATTPVIKNMAVTAIV